MHREGALGLVLALGALAQLGEGRLVAARVGTHEGRRGEDVRVVDAPGGHDGAEGVVVEGEERFPEQRVLVAEGRRHLDVEPVVDEDDFGGARGQPPDEDVARVRVAVDGAPEEHLRGEEVDDGVHCGFEADAEAAFGVGALPGLAVGLVEGVLRGVFGDGRVDVGIVVGGQRGECRAACAGTPLAEAALPAVRDALFVPEPHALDPLGRHDALAAQLAVHLRDVHAAVEPLLAGDQRTHLLRVIRLVLKVRLQHQPLRDIRHKRVNGNPKPPRIRPSHHLESPQIPPHLRGNLPLLDLNRDLAPIRQPRPMHLRDARARPRRPLHDTLPLLPLKPNPKHLLNLSPKILPHHPPHLLPPILRRIIKHLGKHPLKLRRQHRTLHRNRLPNLQIQPPIVP